jgi:uncharacterized membrane protein YeaQ/YmgE (transglycosylase-associated protein family)
MGSLKNSTFYIRPQTTFLVEEIMETNSIILFVIIGIVAGWVSGRIVKGKGFGLFRNLIVGCIGALLGGWIFDQLHLTINGLLGSIVAAVIGALILIWLISFFNKKK